MEVSNHAINRAYGSHLNVFLRREATTAPIIARALIVNTGNGMLSQDAPI